MSLSIFVYPFALSRNMKGVYIDDWNKRNTCI
jgi:hypothetical protein